MIFQLAKRFLFSRDRRQFRSGIILIATAGIFFACFLTIVGLGVLAGYQTVYRQAVLNFSAHIIVFNEIGLSVQEKQAISDFLKASPVQNDFSPYHYTESLLPTTQGFRPIIFKGIDFKKRSQVYPLNFKAFSNDAGSGIWVGQDFLEKQPDILKEGELKFLKLRNVDGDFKTQYQTLKVQGTFESGYYDFDSRFVILPLSQMPELFLETPVTSGFEIRVKNFHEIDLLKEALNKRFSNELHVMGWQELNRSLFEALALDRTVVFAVSFLVLLIACLNIFGFNYLFFIQRKREFLILAALGMPMGGLRRLLTLLSLFLGSLASLAGGFCGALVLWGLKSGPGIPLDPEVYFVDRVPVQWNAPWFYGMLIGAILFCFLTSWLAGRTVIHRNMTGNLLTS